MHGKTRSVPSSSPSPLFMLSSSVRQSKSGSVLGRRGGLTWMPFNDWACRWFREHCWKLRARIAAKGSKCSEQLEDDWERGITQRCLLSQDPENIWNHSESPLLNLRRKPIHCGLAFLQFLSGKAIRSQSLG